MIFIRNKTLGFSVNVSFLLVSSKSFVPPLSQMLNHGQECGGTPLLQTRRVTQAEVYYQPWEENETKKVVRTSKKPVFEVSILFIL